MAYNIMPHKQRKIVYIHSQFTIDPESSDILVAECEGCFPGMFQLQI